jgi:protein phosphatase methylesterase 1
MSDLQRQFAKAKLVEYPAPPSPSFDEAGEDEETDHFNTELELPQDDDSSSASSASSASSTGTIIPSSNQKLFARRQGYELFALEHTAYH